MDLVGGFGAFFASPLKNHGVSNSWDDDIPIYIYYGKLKNVPNHQPNKYSQMRVDRKIDKVSIIVSVFSAAADLKKNLLYLEWRIIYI